MERLGLLGGTFDPPHLGHLILASVVADALALDQVWFVPAADPPHKQGRTITSAAHRLAMLRLVTEPDDRFSLSLIDIERPGPHYSVDMVAEACQREPEAQLYFLMGSDSLLDVPHWYAPEQLIALCELAVLERPGHPLDLDTVARDLPAIRGRVVPVAGPEVALSATQVRARVRQGQSIRYLVTPAVGHYIAAEGLYR
ncbi:MAG: nicotinate (nicotinamide) nucleotide adenylyltransferase [Anaerolineae bacterium]|nr:nicotinate (nicotinamide) nucleotide adenylyltransferase [Anaerolineae bacterium]